MVSVRTSTLRLFVLIGVTASAFSACQNAPADEKTNQTQTTPEPAQPAGTLDNLYWLVGNWHNNVKKGIVFENWERATDGALKGSSGFISGTDTTIGETISIVKQGTDILYIPTVKGQNNDLPVPFALTVSTGDSFVFENPGHDFPQKITYYKMSGDSLRAKISGNINGTEESRTFIFSRG